MSQHDGEVDPVRRRAGLISALVKLYVKTQKLLDEDGSPEEAVQLQEKLHERYTVYLEGHEIALSTYPDKVESLTSSHIRNELRHQQAIDTLQNYIDNGTKPDDDMKSLHAASLFSSRSKKSASTKHSSNRSYVSKSDSHRPSTKHGEDTSRHAAY